ncbi:MAG: cytochrome c [Bacteroidota bacterium]|nr:cytochrome c [Bacteroidota bacterium]
MKILNNKKLTILSILVLMIGSMMLVLNSCTASQKISMKSGAQLWAENCQRCHNTPSPSTFTPEQWETVGMHMQSRALLTETEKNKIVEFLSQ